MLVYIFGKYHMVLGKYELRSHSIVPDMLRDIPIMELPPLLQATLFVPQLIQTLNSSSVVWLYNAESEQVIDSLIAVANNSPCNNHVAKLSHDDRYFDLSDWLQQLSTGPDHLIVLLVTTWHTLYLNDVVQAIAQLETFLCKILVIHEDWQHPLSTMSFVWFPGLLYDLLVSVHFLANRTAAEAIVMHWTTDGCRPQRNATAFLHRPSLLGRILRREIAAVTAPRLNVGVPSTDGIYVESASRGKMERLLFGSNVAVFKLIAERIGVRLMVERSSTLFLQYHQLAFWGQSFGMHLTECPWLRTFTVGKENMM